MGKRIFIDIVGGPQDGSRIDSAEIPETGPTGEQMLFPFFTHKKIGATAWTLSEHGINWMSQFRTHEEMVEYMKKEGNTRPQSHYYRLEDVVEDDDTVFMVVKYLTKEEYEASQKKADP